MSNAVLNHLEIIVDLAYRLLKFLLSSWLDITQDR